MPRALWPRWLPRGLAGRHGARPKTAPARRMPRPRLEALENRITPTTFTPTAFTDGVGGGAVNTLRDAILAANADTGTADDTIQLKAGTYTLSIADSNGQDNMATRGDLDITSTSHKLIIQGATDANDRPATTIDQTAADRVFQIVNAGATVTFRDVVIQGGKAQDDGTTGAAAGSTEALGGGILDGGNVTLDNVILQNNRAQGSNGLDAKGGGIYAANASLGINDSVIQLNGAYAGNGTSPIQNGGNALGGGVESTVSFGAVAELTITRSTVANNLAQGGDGYPSGDDGGGKAYGGGIIAVNTPTVIIASTLMGNRAIGGDSSGNGDAGNAFGGGASLQGAVTLVNSTIAGNTAMGGNSTPLRQPGISVQGGGVNFFGATATLTNVTVADNKALDRQGNPAQNTVGGGIFDSVSTVALTNTLVALNSAAAGPDYFGAVSTSSSHNLIGNADGSSGFSAAKGDLLGSTTNSLNPRLGPLADNGGPTRTLALLSGSPALNAGANSAQSVTGLFDQRGQGLARVVDGAIDIGAFEAQPPPPSPGPAPSPSPSGSPSPPPALHKPFLLALLDELLRGVEVVNGKGTETVTDNLLGFPLVSTYDGAGDLVNVTLLGFDLTRLFE